VILSQFFRGIARSLEKLGSCGGPELARALTLGSATADKAVVRPVEGTMLTVGRDAAQAATTAADAGGDLLDVVEAAVAGARASVARTPLLLPVLRQAGVVDAGGQGLLCLLEGLLGSLRGEAEARPGLALAPAVVAPTPVQYGYCTEFLLRGTRIDLAAIRDRVAAVGDSAIVVGDDAVVRVHVHTFHPGSIIEYACGLGTLHGVKIDNMQDQHEHFLLSPEQVGAVAGRTADSQASRIPPYGRAEPVAAGRPEVVAVASGAGFAAMFRSLGVSRVVAGGQTMNPSTEDLLRAVEDAPSRHVLLLPNNSNVVLAARQVLLLTS